MMDELKAEENLIAVQDMPKLASDTPWAVV